MSGEVVHTEHSVHWKWQTWQKSFDEFLDDFAMKKAGTNLFQLLAVLRSVLLDFTH